MNPFHTNVDVNSDGNFDDIPGTESGEGEDSDVGESGGIMTATHNAKAKLNKNDK